MKNKVFKQAGALVTMLALSATPVLASPLGEYTAEEMAAFQDNTLEYWEIQGLVEHYNPAYLNQLEIFHGNPDGETGLSSEQLINLAAEYRAEASELEDELEDMELDRKDPVYEDYKSNIKVLKRYGKELEDALAGSAATRNILKQVRNQVTIEICAQMRSYQSLKNQDAIQKKNLEIAQMAYDSAVRQMDLGMYSKENLMAAADKLNAAKAESEASSAALTKGKQSLITALGWDYNSTPDIFDVPAPDLNRIALYNLETDLKPAIDCNYDISDLRKTDTKELGGVMEKQKQIREKEDQVRMQMEFLYRDVQQKQASYLAALDGWPAAEAAKAQAERKYALGMISKQEFLQAEAEWLQVKASRDEAALALTAAMENYEWALDGVMKL